MLFVEIIESGAHVVIRRSQCSPLSGQRMQDHHGNRAGGASGIRFPRGILGYQPRPQPGVLLRSGHGGQRGLLAASNLDAHMRIAEEVVIPAWMTILTVITSHDDISGSIRHILQGVAALLAAFALGSMEDQHSHVSQATSEPPVALFIDPGHRAINQGHHKVRESHQHETLPSQSKLGRTLREHMASHGSMGPWPGTAEILFRALDRITTSVPDSSYWANNIQ
jgi:hypothetical protein